MLKFQMKPKLVGSVVKKLGLFAAIVSLVAVQPANSFFHHDALGIPKPTSPIPHPLDKERERLKREAFVELHGPPLAALIKAGKADALRGEVIMLPDHVMKAMSAYFSAEILNTVRYRVGGGDFTIQMGSIRLGGRDAVTLDDVIVFRSHELVNNLHLVAHELGHVEQYHKWGITDFAKRYVRDFQSVEADAERMANAWETTQPGYQPPVAKRSSGGGGGGGGRLSNKPYQQLQ